MEISLLQAFALGIIAFIAGLDMFNGLTHMHRPVHLFGHLALLLGCHGNLGVRHALQSRHAHVSDRPGPVQKHGACG